MSNAVTVGSPVDWLGSIEHDAAALEVAARDATAEASVPGCPGWTVTDLLEHVGSVFYRASLIIGERRDRGPHRSETTAPVGDPFGWYEAGRTTILTALRTADPAATYWTFRGPNPLRWWLRRLANEAAIHRIDAEQAAGVAPLIDLRVAIDGIDEKLETYLPVLAVQNSPERPVTVSLCADDLGAAWTITIGTEVTVQRYQLAAEATVTGTADNLYLWLWDRAPSERVRIGGDLTAAEALRAAGRV